MESDGKAEGEESRTSREAIKEEESGGRRGMR